VEEPGEHLAARVGGEEVVLVTFDDCGAFVPVVIAIEKGVVNGVWVATVGACGVVPGVPSKAEGVVGGEGMAGD
jgi:hypothetical protein